jgi:hypothetical protein
MKTAPILTLGKSLRLVREKVLVHRRSANLVTAKLKSILNQRFRAPRTFPQYLRNSHWQRRFKVATRLWGIRISVQWEVLA